MLDYDLDIRIGDSYLSPRWAIVIAGAAVQLEPNWTVRAQIRAQADDVVPLFEFDSEQILITTVTVQVAGVEVDTSAIQLYIPPPVSETFTAWSGVWDCEIANSAYGPGGTEYRRTIVGGQALLTGDVTR